jgi:hypothetical protein
VVFNPAESVTLSEKESRKVISITTKSSILIRERLHKGDARFTTSDVMRMPIPLHSNNIICDAQSHRKELCNNKYIIHS